jgi:cell division protein FtsB
MRDTSIKRSWLVLLALVALSVAYGYWRGLIPRYLEYVESSTSLQELRLEVQTAYGEEAQLQQRVSELRENRVEQEASIRRGQNLVRPGETVYRIKTAP